MEHGRGLLDWVVGVARENKGRHVRFKFQGGRRFGSGNGGGGFAAKSCGRITATEITGGNLGERIREALRDELVAGGAGACVK